MSRPTILFCAEAVTLAHVARPIALGEGLDPGRYHRVFACDERYRSFFPSGDWHCRNIHSISGRQFAEALSKGRPLYSVAVLREYVREDFALLKKIRPSAVVGDFRLSLSISARLCGVPYLAISNAYWSPYATPDRQIPSHPLVGVLGVPIANLIFRLSRPLVFATHSGPLNQLRREYGLASLGRRLECYTDADITLYADAREMVPVANSPSTHRYLGPISWSPDVPMPDGLDSVPPDAPIIYVTLGSSGRASLLQTVLYSLAPLRCRVYASTAGAPWPVSVPANAVLSNYLPGQAMARRASLVVCNGGSPTTQQALLAGTPVVGIADNMDQYLNMAYIQATGAGWLIRQDQANIKSVSAAVTTVLRNESYHLAAVRLAHVLNTYSAPQAFAAIIDELLA